MNTDLDIEINVNKMHAELYNIIVELTSYLHGQGLIFYSIVQSFSKQKQKIWLNDDKRSENFVEHLIFHKFFVYFWEFLFLFFYNTAQEGVIE